MKGSSRRLLALAPVALVLVVASGTAADAQNEAEQVAQPSVVLLIEPVGCGDPFNRLLCDGFTKASRRAGVTARIISASTREDPVDTLELVARQRHDLVIAFGFQYFDALGEVAVRRPEQRFAVLDRSRLDIERRPRNVRGVVFRSTEAAYLAGFLAARLEQRRAGPDVLGVVGGVKLPAVDDFIVGFRAGARRASPGVKVFVGYSNDFVDPSKCEAIARKQIARGAGAVFNVAGGCGLGALQAAKDRGVWGIGVDTDQSFLGPHVLTSVVKRFDVGFLKLLRELRSGAFRTPSDTVLTLRDGGVALSRINHEVPSALRAEIDRLRRRIVAGEIRVPGTVPNPR